MIFDVRPTVEKMEGGIIEGKGSEGAQESFVNRDEALK